MSNKSQPFSNDSFAVAARNFYLGLSLFVCAIAAALHSAGALAADASIQQVYEAANAGNYSQAQRMMNQVLHDHPGSAKAHFVEAELLAKQGLRARSASELQSAERIDPALSFARPAAVQALKAHLAAPASGGQLQYGAAQLNPAHAGFPWGVIVTIMCLAAAVAFFLRARRQTQSYLPAGGNTGAPLPTGASLPYGAQPPYAPGYGSGYGPGYAPMSGGMGSSILGGLATGAAVGAGMVAGESLMHHVLDGGRSQAAAFGNGYVPLDGAQGVDGSYDMGGNDFGVADASSWDDGDMGGLGDMSDVGSSDWN